ncbi:TetR/AcrR family transcriptional regulator [Ferrovum myxofaciens]|jgi:TetR/AcrR family transcriptional repressor of lmrAB and yxaGH operons|uniref:TetR/AcrR family transcriptional regulator n=1 Tax=Ferrovum myxofaciens TaxID=416213 RepID=UPI0004E1E59F|nr:TetR/AcrR family transcriptional regulator [Ferrovum myxofaciens]MBU6995210.1 TetR/AcrR family transcriptional regulator [Ferrovum myxofaciens]QKE39994.1 MAG: TetR/AcrR family transcriptional regulator [Ferrovum myxofaciens]
MARKGEQTRERLLAATLNLIERHGFHNVGLQRILNESSTPKGSLYFHFPGGKDQLVAQALAMGSQAIGALMQQCFQAPSAAAGIEFVARELEGRLQASDFQKGCPVATVALEVGDEHPEVRRACEQAYADWLDAIATALKRHGATAIRAREDALMILSSIEGALILARATRSVQPLRTICRMLVTRLQEVPAMSDQ